MITAPDANTVRPLNRLLELLGMISSVTLVIS